MPNPLIILDAMPSPDVFYKTYWNRQPFVVPEAITEDAFHDLISADELAGLAMDDAPQSRMVMTAGAHHDWACRFGPFSEDDFKSAGNADWSLLVQNVEQFHPETATLLRHFNFAPRWLMDDIMVSYSTPGGSVGPHVDSYHVFLVQGQGRRFWKVARQPLAEQSYLPNLEMKILDADFDGDEIEVGLGDVLYLPPNFAHQGTTLEEALTFSVGFLGPRLSELYGSYGQYLSEYEDLDQRYVGDGLSGDSAGFQLAPAAVVSLQDTLTQHLHAKDFPQWLVEFFTESGHEDFATFTERDTPLGAPAFTARLNEGAALAKPEYVKFAITGTHLGFDNHSFRLDDDCLPIIQKLAHEKPVTLSDTPGLADHLEVLRELYNHQALEFTDA